MQTESDQPNYWQGRLTRRTWLRRGSAAGAGGLPALALAACGGANNNKPKAAATITGSAPTATSASGIQGAQSGTPMRGAVTPGVQAAPATTAAQVKKGGRFKYSENATPSTFEYQLSLETTVKNASANRVYSKLYRPVGVPVSEAGKNFPPSQFSGDVAAAAPEITDGGLTYTIKLRTNAKYTAPINRQLDSEDVAFAFNRYLGRISGINPAVNADQYEAIDKIETPDKQTAVFKLKHPLATFLLRIADDNLAFVLPKETGTAFDPAKTMVGTGPWTLKSITPSVGFSFDRNPDWHLGPDAPYLDGIDAIVIPQYANALNQFTAGNLHFLGSIQVQDLKGIKDGLAGVNLVPYPVVYYVGFGMSGKDKSAPWVKDPRVRQAMSNAIDRDALFDAIYPSKDIQAAGLPPLPVKWHTAFGANHSRYWIDPKTDSRMLPYLKYDPNGAKQLLSAAGYPNGFELSLHTTTGYGPVWQKHSELIGTFLGQIGLKVNEKVDDFATVFITKTFKGDFDGIAQAYFGGVEPGELYNLMYPPGAAYNISGVDDADVTDQVNKIQTELDADKRGQMIKDLQITLVQKMYYLPGVYDAGAQFQAWNPKMKDGEKYCLVRGTGASRDPFLWLSA